MTFASSRVRSTALPILLLTAGTLLCWGSGPAVLAQTPEAGIDWRPFRASAFEEAAKADKLVFLWIHAPWGHWDRIMEEVTFKDPEVVDLVNQKVIPIRVNALLRPDVYARYGVGNWPTCAFLLSTGQPLFYMEGQTRKMNRAGTEFLTADELKLYLKGLVENYEKNPESAHEIADRIEYNLLTKKEIEEAPLSTDLVEVSVTQFIDAYKDWKPDPAVRKSHFPDTDSVRLAFQYYARKRNSQVLDIALRNLTEMARGGIRDHIGGGFHRASLDAAWRIPAFEKLLHGNADLLRAYVDVHGLSGNERYLEIAQGIIDYVMGTLRAPGGWFYAYQAADATIGDDGDYYTWTVDEVKEILGEEEQAIILPAYDIASWGEMIRSAPRKNVLFIQEGPYLLSKRLKMDEQKVEALFESGRRKMLDARSARKAPEVGKVLIADANAAMAAALIEAGDRLGKPDLVEAGLGTIDFLWSRVRDAESGFLVHAWSEEGMEVAGILFTDQVRMIDALIVAYESTGKKEYLDRAQQLADSSAKAFHDTLNGAWMDRIYDPEAPGLMGWPVRTLRDNGLFAECLVRLRHYTGYVKYSEMASEELESWADEFGSSADQSSSFGLAVDRLMYPPLEVIVVGDPGKEDTESVRRQARSLYHPWKLMVYRSLEESAGELAARQLSPVEAASCFFCKEGHCAGPVQSGGDMSKALEDFLESLRK